MVVDVVVDVDVLVPVAVLVVVVVLVLVLVAVLVLVLVVVIVLVLVLVLVEVDELVVLVVHKPQFAGHRKAIGSPYSPHCSFVTVSQSVFVKSLFPYGARSRFEKQLGISAVMGVVVPVDVPVDVCVLVTVLMCTHELQVTGQSTLMVPNSHASLPGQYCGSLWPLQ